jgi:hypothetical protein
LLGLKVEINRSTSNRLSVQGRAHLVVTKPTIASVIKRFRHASTVKAAVRGLAATAA